MRSIRVGCALSLLSRSKLREENSVVDEEEFIARIIVRDGFRSTSDEKRMDPLL